MAKPRSGARTFLFALCGALFFVGLYQFIVALEGPGQATDGVNWKNADVGLQARESRDMAAGGIRAGDTLLAVDGRAIQGPADLEILHALGGEGSRHTYSVLRNGEYRDVDVLLHFNGPGQARIFLAFVGFVWLLVALSILCRTVLAPADKLFALMGLSLFVLFTFGHRGVWDPLDKFVFVLDEGARLILPPLMLHFFVLFPRRLMPAGRRRLFSPALFYLPATVLALLNAGFILSGGFPPVLSPLSAVGALNRAELAHFAAFLCGSLGCLVVSWRRSLAGEERKQLLWVFSGLAGGFGPFLVFYLLPRMVVSDLHPAAADSTVFFLLLTPIAFAYAIARRRLMDTEIIIKRGLVFGATAMAAVLIYLSLVEIFGPGLLGLPTDAPTAVGVLAAVLVASLSPTILKTVQGLADRVFYRERFDYRRTILEFGRELSAEIDFESCTARLEERLLRTVGVSKLAIWVRGESDMEYAIKSMSGIADHGLVPQTLSFHSAEILASCDAGFTVLDRLSGVIDMPKEAGLRYFFPIMAKGRQIGLLGAGAAGGGALLSSEDIEMIVVLTGYAAIAMENARLYRTLKENLREVESLKEYSENIIESSMAGILVLDLEDRIRDCNRTFEKILGIPRNWMRDRKASMILPQALLEKIGEDAERNAGQAQQVSVTQMEGREINVLVSVSPLKRKSGEVVGTLVLLEDVTRQVDEELRRVQQEKLASLGLLAAGIAHEVNTPLAGIASYIQMLMREIPEEDSRGAVLRKIDKQCFRAARIVNRLLTFSRGASREKAPVSINGIVRDSLELLDHRLSRSSIKVTVRMTDDETDILGSEGDLQQVFVNIILNAVEAMPHGGELSIESRAGDNDVIVTMADTGCGIKPDHVGRIFDPFFTTKGNTKGSGLGLAVTYGIVAEHDGTITVKDREGEGTMFVLSFPRKTRAESGDEQSEPAGERG